MAAATQRRPADIEGADTLSERAADLIERDILAGRLAPGIRLGILDLADRYEIGATPLREGLSRLLSSGLIVSIGQRGFRVAELSKEDLADITCMRLTIELEALRLSMARGDDTWEAGILSAIHQMRRYTERTGSNFREGSPEFDRLHKSFHSALLAACGSKRLLAAHSELYDQAYRYRRVMMRKFSSAKRFIAAHQALADCVIARDGSAAKVMLTAHLRSTLAFVYPPRKGTKE